MAKAEIEFSGYSVRDDTPMWFAATYNCEELTVSMNTNGNDKLSMKLDKDECRQLIAFLKVMTEGD